MIWIYKDLFIEESELDMSAIRSQGSGGQNVNKVSTAIHLRFPIRESSLPEEIKMRLLAFPDSRKTEDGVLIIKAQNHRTQLRNKEEAVERLRQFFREALTVRKKRKPTKPRKAAVEKRLLNKKKLSEKKSMRRMQD